MNLLNIDSLILFKRLSVGSLAVCIASMLLAIGTPPILQIIFLLHISLKKQATTKGRHKRER